MKIKENLYCVSELYKEKNKDEYKILINGILKAIEDSNYDLQFLDVILNKSSWLWNEILVNSKINKE